MKIMDFMMTQSRASNSAFPVKVQAPAICQYPSRAPGLWSPWILGLVASSWVTASIHATASPLGSTAGPESLAAVTPTLSILPGQDAIYPILGLLAAVVSTYILRRRRVAQLEAIAAEDR